MGIGYDYSIPFCFKDPKMSETRTVVGMAGKLKTPVSPEVIVETYDRKDGISFNSDGTIIFLSQYNVPAHEFDIQVGFPISALEFEKICERAGFGVVKGTTRPFFANWYTGTDSPLTMLTLDQFFSMGWSS